MYSRHSQRRNAQFPVWDKRVFYCLPSTSSVANMTEFVLLIYMHSPHANEYSSSCFLQKHLRVSQSLLQLHVPIFSRAYCIVGRPVFLNKRGLRTRCQAHSSGSRSPVFPHPLLQLQMHTSTRIRCEYGDAQSTWRVSQIVNGALWIVTVHSCCRWLRLAYMPIIISNELQISYDDEFGNNSW